jgi:hypothetical protein
MKRIALAAALTLGVLAYATPAQAADVRIGIQIGSDRGYGGSRGSYGRDYSRIAFDNGYRDGLRLRIAYRGRDSGYRSDYGRRSSYTEAYRRGYIEAYRLSISSRGRYERWDDRGRNNRYNDRYDRSNRRSNRYDRYDRR